MSRSPGFPLLAWAAHAYTALGAVLGFLAATDVSQNQIRRAFLWLFLANVVDATDGMLARAAKVSARLPWFDGALLDNIVDYVTYVFVPVFIVWQALLVPDTWSVPVCAAVLLSSAYGFSRRDAKTDDHFFAGFPSYWNIVVFYLFVFRWSPVVNLVVLGVLIALVFVPVYYVYPSRTSRLHRTTLGLGAVWACMVGYAVLRPGDASVVWLWVSLGFPLYYFMLSLVLTSRRAPAGLTPAPVDDTRAADRRST